MTENMSFNKPAHKEKHTIQLNYFIELDVSFSNLQRILSLINTLALMVTDNIDPRIVPELFFTKIETDSIFITFESDNSFYVRFKNIIKDLNLIKTIDKTPKESYLVPVIKRTYQLYKQRCLVGNKYLLLQEYDLGDLSEFAKFIFSWGSKITAINGKAFEEKLTIDNKEAVLQAYNLNKDNMSDTVYSNAALDNIDLSYANFKNAELIATNLMKTSLEHAIFENADLTEANLIGTMLANANLSNANLSTAQLMEADLSEANLTGATLSGTFLIGANLRRCNLSKTNLNSAILARSDASRALFNDCIAPNTNFVGVNATEANFTNANFTNGDFSTARLQGVNIHGANFSHVKMLETTLTGIVIFDSVNFDQSDWWNASDISEDLLKYLKHVFPCPQTEEERCKHFEELYGKSVTDEIIAKQNKLLGIKEKVQQPHIDDINLDASQLTPELLAKLADSYLDEQ